MVKNNPKSTAVTDKKLADLKTVSLMTRMWIINMTHEAGSGHPGGSLSATDIVSTLYFHVMKHDPKRNSGWENRDRFILSKGHAAPALYAALAQSGYFEKELILKFLKKHNPKFYDNFVKSKHFKKLKSSKNFGLDLQMTLRKLGSPLQGHPDMTKLPGIEASTGSEGQGLSIGIGMAIAGKLNRKDYRVYVLLGDGEMDCGQIWEAAMAATHLKVIVNKKKQKLDNLVAIVDRNRLQLDSFTQEIMDIEPLADKWKSFGWKVINIDGHDFSKLIKALDTTNDQRRKPTVIIADTIKGSCVKCMENSPNFHGKPPNDKEYVDALDELLEDLHELNLKKSKLRDKRALKALLEVTEKHLRPIKYDSDFYKQTKKEVLKTLRSTRSKL